MVKLVYADGGKTDLGLAVPVEVLSGAFIQKTSGLPCGACQKFVDAVLDEHYMVHIEQLFAPPWAFPSEDAVPQ